MQEQDNNLSIANSGNSSGGSAIQLTIEPPSSTILPCPLIEENSNSPKENTLTITNNKTGRKRSVTCNDTIVDLSHKRSRILKMDNFLLTSIDESSTLSSIWQLPSMIHSFDSISPNLKSYLLFQLLKRSSTNTLQFVNSVIMPILKHDFLSTLPLEVVRRITSYLDAFSLCRASGVCKKWKTIIDADHPSWKRLLLEDGYSLSDPLDLSMIEIDNYKQLYARHHTLRQNWRKGRATEQSFCGHGKSVVTCLQFDDERIVSGADDSHVNIYSTHTGKKLMTLEGHEGGVWALQYVGNTLVTGSTDRRVRVWDMETGKCTHIFAGHTSTIRCLLITKPIEGEDEQPMIITGSRDATLRVWKLPDPKHEPGHFYGNGHNSSNPYFVCSLVGNTQSVRAIASHGDIVVSGSYDHTVRVWSIKKGRQLHLMEGHTQKVYSVVIDAKRNRCMSGSMDSTIRIWDLATGECLKRLDGHTVLVGLLGLSDQYLVSAAADSILRIWSPETGTCQHALSGHGNSITCFQHDNTKIISGSEGGLKMWDVKTGRFVRDLVTDVDCVWRVAFDERRCVAAVQKKNETSFRILDFGAYNLEQK